MTSRWKRPAIDGFEIHHVRRTELKVSRIAVQAFTLVRIQDGLSDVVSSPVYVSTTRFLSLCLQVLQPGMKELDQAARMF